MKVKVTHKECFARQTVTPTVCLAKHSLWVTLTFILKICSWKSENWSKNMESENLFFLLGGGREIQNKLVSCLLYVRVSWAVSKQGWWTGKDEVVATCGLRESLLRRTPLQSGGRRGPSIQAEPDRRSWPCHRQGAARSPSAAWCRRCCPEWRWICRTSSWKCRRILHWRGRQGVCFRLRKN